MQDRTKTVPFPKALASASLNLQSLQ